APPPVETALGAHVLVVEDNAVNREVAVAMLEGLGYRVSVAESGSEALALLDRLPPDLVLMDCEMPEMDGYTATAAIRRREKGTAPGAGCWRRRWPRPPRDWRHSAGWSTASTGRRSGRSPTCCGGAAGTWGRAG